MNDRSNDPQIYTEAGIAPARPSEIRDPHTEGPQSEAPPLPARRRRGGGWIWLVALLVLIAAGVGAWWWSGGGSSAAPEQAKGKGRGDPSGRPMPVVAAAARTGNIDVFINALGTVIPR